MRVIGGGNGWEEEMSWVSGVFKEMGGWMVIEEKEFGGGRWVSWCGIG